VSDHTNIRLETTGGTVIAYFAPNFTVRPVLDNDLKGGRRPREQPPVTKDLQLIKPEISIQGAFEHSDELPEPHRNDLQTLFGSSTVTARDQINRIRDFMNQGGPFVLYDGPDEYSATSSSGVDRANGVFPVVNIDQFRPPSQAGHSRAQYTVKMRVGVPI